MLAKELNNVLVKIADSICCRTWEHQQRKVNTGGRVGDGTIVYLKLNNEYVCKSECFNKIKKELSGKKKNILCNPLQMLTTVKPRYFMIYDLTNKAN